MTIWKPTRESSSKPIYIHLADSLEADIGAGALKSGDRLPTHRDLAEVMGVTVGTVTRGYSEAHRRGLIRGEVGRGTVVAPMADNRPGFYIPENLGPAVIDLGLVTPLYHLDPDLGVALRTVAGQRRVQELLQYQPARGCLRHREAGAKWIGRYGLSVGPEDVLVTSGGQHGLVVLLSSLFRPGDRILAESLSYPGLVGAAHLLGLRLVPVDMDEHGIVPEAMAECCSKDGVRGLYLMPNCHNPTTACLPAKRREEIAFIARQKSLLVIEDETYGLTADSMATPLSAIAPERTFFVAGFSKAVAGGLRIAYIRAPREYVDKLSQGISSTTWMAAPLCAEVAALWVNDGTAETVCARKRAEARARNLLARKILNGHRFQCQDFSHFLWLNLPEPWRGSEFEREAKERGVAVVSAEKFVVGQAHLPMAVRLSLSGTRDREDLAKGLHLVADMLKGQPGPGLAML